MVSKIFSENLNITLDEDIENIINEKASIINLSEKEILVLEGEIQSKLYFIIEGIVRGYYIDENGNDITKCFSYEKQFFSTEGLLTNKEASFTIETLEKCKVIMFPYALVRELLQKDIIIKDLFKDLLINEVKKLEIQKKNYSLMNAENRYKEFCMGYPDLSRRVDLQYIASFIGVRPSSLSRIRRKCN